MNGDECLDWREMIPPLLAPRQWCTAGSWIISFPDCDVGCHGGVVPSVEEVCKIWIWLFRNISCTPSRVLRGERFEGSSVVRMSRGKTCFRLPFCRQEAVRTRQKTVTANLNSRDLMYRLGLSPKSGTRPIWAISVENRRPKSRCTFVYRLVARSLGGIPLSGVCPHLVVRQSPVTNVTGN